MPKKIKTLPLNLTLEGPCIIFCNMFTFQRDTQCSCTEYNMCCIRKSFTLLLNSCVISRFLTTGGNLLYSLIPNLYYCFWQHFFYRTGDEGLNLPCIVNMYFLIRDHPSHIWFYPAYHLTYIQTRKWKYIHISKEVPRGDLTANFT